MIESLLLIFGETFQACSQEQLSIALNTVSTMVNIIAIVIAIIAICVAVHGNRQSQKQFQANMVKQEQTLNAQLLEKRIQVLNFFRKEKTDSFQHFMEKAFYGDNLDLELFRVLFSNSVVKEYDDICAIVQKRSEYEVVANKLMFNFKHRVGLSPDELEDTLDFAGKIDAAEREALSAQAADEDKEKFINLSSSLSAGDPDNNYGRLKIAAKKLDLEVETRKKQLIDSMTEEIRQSVDCQA